MDEKVRTEIRQARINICTKGLRDAVKHVDESKTALIEARAEVIVYKSLEKGISEIIAKSVGDLEGHYALSQVIEDVELTWGNELREVIRLRYEAEEYFKECEEERENAIEHRSQATKELDMAMQAF